MSRSRPVTATMPVTISVGCETIELVATVQASYTPADKTPVTSTTISPPDPEAIEDKTLVSLITDDRRELPRDCPQWLADAIFEQADDKIREAAER